MVKPPFIVIAGRPYRSKTAVKREAQRILNSTLGDVINRDDDEFLRALLAMHPKVKERTGVGVGYFKVREHKIKDHFRVTRGFYIHRIDGTWDVFSLYTAVDGENTYFEKVVRAARIAANDQTYAFKVQWSPDQETGICSISKKSIPWREAHVDHAGDYPFQRIVDLWCASLGQAYYRIPLKEEIAGDVFATKEARDHFVKFHDKLAVLRVIHKSLHKPGAYRSVFVPPEREN